MLALSASFYFRFRCDLVVVYRTMSFTVLNFFFFLQGARKKHSFCLASRLAAVRLILFKRRFWARRQLALARLFLCFCCFDVSSVAKGTNSLIVLCRARCLHPFPFLPRTVLLCSTLFARLSICFVSWSTYRESFQKEKRERVAREQKQLTAAWQRLCAFCLLWEHLLST